MAKNLGDLRDRFTAAFDALIEEVKRDRSILAAILCGSLSHDTVWSGSDIDLVLITIDDKKTKSDGLSLYADGINVHAVLMPRTEFRRSVEGAIRTSFEHSFFAKGRLIYTHDDTIAALCAQLQQVGDRDRKIQLFHSGCHALPGLYKAHKWLLTRHDLDYSSLYLLMTAQPLAKIEVLNAGLLADREVLPQAMKLNPAFFKIIYTDLLNSKKTEKSVKAALDAADGYLAQRAKSLFAPLLEHLQEVGEARSSTEIDDHFRRNYGFEGVTGACEYLSDIGLVGKAPMPVRLTKKSNVDVQELAFFYSSKAADAR